MVHKIKTITLIIVYKFKSYLIKMASQQVKIKHKKVFINLKMLVTNN